MATPLLSLAVGVKTAVAISIVPNIVMDFIQVVRRGGVLASVRRLSVLLLFGLVGTFVGTRLLAVLPPRVATMVLGAFVLLFVGLNVGGSDPTFPPRGSDGCRRRSGSSRACWAASPTCPARRS